MRANNNKITYINVGIGKTVGERDANVGSKFISGSEGRWVSTSVGQATIGKVTNYPTQGLTRLNTKEVRGKEEWTIKGGDWCCCKCGMHNKSIRTKCWREGMGRNICVGGVKT